jgi:hypothetical protein
MKERSTPEDMDRWARNERLYRNLRDQGLFVEPIYSERGIEYLQVATSMPDPALSPSGSADNHIKHGGKRRLVALRNVVAPVERLKIR